MHSSRMLTARLLPASPSLHYAGGCLLPEGSAPGGGVYPSMTGADNPPPREQNDRRV